MSIELAVFSVRVDSWRKIGEETPVKFPSGESTVEILGIDTDYNSIKAVFDEIPGKSI
jgi:hypothetical protein